jgi:uncharacterized MAPEG superfamily protein
VHNDLTHNINKELEMDIAFWCVLIAGVLPIACAGLSKFTGEPSNGRFDNHHPREWLARQSGARSRANAAQANSWEAFPFFAAGVIIAHLQHVDLFWINLAAVVFIAARLVYIALYISNQASLRSLIWSVGWLATISLYLLAATGTLR